MQVSLDTSFLITFADPGRPNHAVALEYFRHCLTQRIPRPSAAPREIMTPVVARASRPYVPKLSAPTHGACFFGHSDLVILSSFVIRH
jgi:hypothetical protein